MGGDDMSGHVISPVGALLVLIGMTALGTVVFFALLLWVMSR